jgi:hypothetical protein
MWALEGFRRNRRLLFQFPGLNWKVLRCDIRHLGNDCEPGGEVPEGFEGDR